MAASTPSLKNLLGDWRKLLTDWAASGQLTAAAQDALRLSGEPKLLKQLVKQWSSGNFSALPPIVLLPSSSMPGAAGAYAISKGTIYLNQDWLQTASKDSVMSVLTEELGHHLDGLLNTVDTPGDEGEFFARILTGNPMGYTERQYLASQSDSSIISPNGTSLAVELASSTSFVSPPDIQWVRLLGSGSNSLASGYSISAVNDSIYIGGVTNLSMGGQQAYGQEDMFISKYSTGGESIWNKQIGTEYIDFDTFVTCRADETIYFTGTTRGNLNGAQNTYLGRSDIAVGSLDKAGNNSWTSLMGTTIPERGKSITTSKDGSVYSTGLASYYGLDGQSGFGYYGSAFLTKYNPDNTKAWTRLIASNNGNVGGFSVATGTDNTIYIAGYTEGDIDGVTKTGPRNAFVSSFNADGSKRWTQLFGPGANDIAFSVVSSPDGSIYVTGDTSGSIDGQLNSGGTDIFLYKFSASGELAWSRLFGSVGNDSGQSLAVDANGSLLLAGYVEGSLNQQSTIGGRDIVLMNISPQGETSWTKVIGTTESDWASGITILPDNSVYLTGFSGGALGDQLNQYNGDAFLMKLAIPKPPIIRVNNISIIEGITANTLATLTVTLNSTSTQAATVNYATVDGTAKAGSDYTATSGTLTIAAGQSSGTISIPILNDNVNEANESFTVQLSNPVNATLSTTSATVTISDTLTSAVTAVLPAGVENLTLTGSALANGTGNAGPNVLTGNSAANTLAGLAGNDTYRFVANTQLGSDTVTEAASAGTDSINLAGTTTAVRLNLGITTLQTVNANLKLTITTTNTIENAVGGNSDDVLTGNALPNALTGGTGADRLSGLAGNDLLDGGLGNDLLTGGLGADRFRFASGAAFATTIGNDAIYEFISGEDKIELSKKTFTAITTAAGSPLASFTTVDDDSLVDSSASVIVYSSSSGGLFYNMNGATTGDATKVFEFASLGNVPATLLAADFTVIA